MKSVQALNARVTPAYPLRHHGVFCFSIAVLSLLQSAQAQSTGATGGSFVAGDRDLVSIDFSQTPVGAPPASIRLVTGTLEVVDKDGTHMLRSSSAAVFLVLIPEKIPDHFTLEFDIVPKASGETGVTELSFEGTRQPTRSESSAQVMWNHHTATVIGGGMDYSQTSKAFPDDLREEIIGNRTQVRAAFDGDNMQLFTNGQQIYDLKGVKFVRGRVLRVELGGTDAGENAVYLARFRIAASGSAPATAQNQSGLTATSSQPTEPKSASSGTTSNLMTDSSTDTHTASPVSSSLLAITGIKVIVDSAGVASVSWDPLTISATYQVLRWNISDPTCCNNMSPPGAQLQSTSWRDGVLAAGTTYGYRVIATTAGGLVAGETRFTYSGAPTPPPGVATTGTTPTLSDRTIATAPVSTTSSTYLTPGRLAAISPTGSSPTTSAEPVATVSAVPAVQTGTITPMTGTSVSGATVATLPVLQTGSVATTNTGDSNSGPGMPASGRYRVVLSGFTVQGVTKDDATNADGKGDEVYAVAAVVNWNRNLNQLTSFNTVHTRDYGDVGTTNGFGDRIKAGSASMTGGLAVGDHVPGSYDIATGTGILSPESDQFPLLVWEGTLTGGADAVVISPSLWKRDWLRVHLTAYTSNWQKTSVSGLMISPVVANQLLSTSLTSSVTTLASSVSMAPPTPTFSGEVTNGYQIVETQFVQGNDRPIGLGRGGLLVVTYQDRFIVLTQEKVASLTVGAGVNLPIFYTEPNNLTTLGANYTLYVRVERTQ